jgi:hypothetical protein
MHGRARSLSGKGIVELHDGEFHHINGFHVTDDPEELFIGICWKDAGI